MKKVECTWRSGIREPTGRASAGPPRSRLLIVPGKTQHIPDLIHVHIQDHGQLINGELRGVVIVSELFNRGFQVFHLGYQIVVTEFLLCLLLDGVEDPAADATAHPGRRSSPVGRLL